MARVETPGHRVIADSRVWAEDSAAHLRLAAAAADVDADLMGEADRFVLTMELAVDPCNGE